MAINSGERGRQGTEGQNRERDEQSERERRSKLKGSQRETVDRGDKKADE